MAQYNWAQPTVQTNVIGNSSIANTAIGLGNVGSGNINNYIPFFTTYNGGLAYGNVTQLIANASLQFDGANLTVGNLTLNAGGDISTTGNISGSYILGNGAFLTGITGTGNYSNANVASYLPVYSGNITSVNTVTASANVSGNALYAFDGAVFNSNTVNTSFTVNGYNAGSIGPITTAPGVVIDIVNGSWVIS